MEKAFREFIKRAWVERLKTQRQFKKMKAPVEFSGELSGSQFYQWRTDGRAVTLALVFSQGRSAIGVRLYWQSDNDPELDVVGSKAVRLPVDGLPAVELLLALIKEDRHSQLEADRLLRGDPDPWYLAPFPPRGRIEPLMELPAVVEEMKLVSPSALNGGWRCNRAWDNWTTVEMYGGPLTATDASYACAKPVESMLFVLDQYLLPISGELMMS